MLTDDQKRIKGNWQMRSDIVTLKELHYFSATHVYQLFDIIDDLDKRDTEDLKTIPIEILIAHLTNHINENPDFRFKNLDSIETIKRLFMRQQYENVAVLRQTLIEELTTFFEHNIVSGEKISEFNINVDNSHKIFTILLRGFDENFNDDIAKKNVREIGHKFGVHLGFDPGLMPK